MRVSEIQKLETESKPKFRQPKPGEIGGKELNPDDVFRSIQYWKKWNKAALNIIKPNKKSHKKTRRK